MTREITPWQESGEFNLTAAVGDPKECDRQIKALNGWWEMLQKERDAALAEYATWDHSDDQQHADSILMLRATYAEIEQLCEDLTTLYQIRNVKYFP